MQTAAADPPLDCGTLRSFSENDETRVGARPRRGTRECRHQLERPFLPLETHRRDERDPRTRSHARVRPRTLPVSEIDAVGENRNFRLSAERTSRLAGDEI